MLLSETFRVGKSAAAARERDPAAALSGGCRRNVSTDYRRTSTRRMRRTGRDFMYKLSRRSLLLSSAALAAGIGVGRAFAQSDVSATLKLQAFGGDAQLAVDPERHRALQQEISQRQGRGRDRPDLDRLGRLRHQGARPVQRRPRGRRLRHRHRDLPGLRVARPVHPARRLRQGQEPELSRTSRRACSSRPATRGRSTSSRSAGTTS